MQEDDKELSIVEIDFTKTKDGQLDESFVQMFGYAVKNILQRMFGGNSVPINVKGSRSQVKAFAKTLAGEKRYYKNYVKYGLDDPRTYRSKYALKSAVSKFERSTGVKWPFK